MAQQEEKLNEFFNGRAFLWIVGIVLALGSWVAMLTGRFSTTEQGVGLYFAFPDILFEDARVSLAVNLACLGGIAALLVLLNKLFNFVRAFTFVFSSMFLLLELASPLSSARLGVGTLMALLLVGGVFLLFSQYMQRGQSQRSIFLVMAVLSLCTLFHFAFIFLIPVFFVGFLYVRAMSIKGFVAMLLGLATPLWIGVGFGLIDPLAYQHANVAAIWAARDFSRLPIDILTAVVTAVVTIVFTVINLMTVLNYRLQTRVYNAFFVVLSMLAVAAMAIDFNNIIDYLPILNLCLAIQVAHLFTTITSPRRYLLIVLLAIASLTSYALQTFS